MFSLRIKAASLLLGLGIGIGLTSTHATVVLQGDYLRVGVHSSGGLIDNGDNVGIDYDKTGTGTWTGYDFLKPGTPYEFYSVGYEGGPSGGFASAGFYYGNTLGASTVDTSFGTTLSTLTEGNYGLLAISQALSYQKSGGTINFAVTLTNTGSDALNNVVYARGLDPDQDVFAGGFYETINTIVNPNLVIGSAPITDWTIGIFSDSPYDHTPTIINFWPFSDPYYLLNPQNDGNGDYSINMAWSIGTLAAGASAIINFEYRIAETRGDVITPPPTNRVPDTGATMSLLGLAMAAFIGARRWQIRA